MMAGSRVTRSTCCYCGVGCGVLIESEHAEDGTSRIIGVRGDPDHPANYGKLCTKGSTLHLTADPIVYAQARAGEPELRRQRQAKRERASWDDALNFVAQRLADIVAQHGPDAVGFYVSGQLLTEDYYVFNKLAKGLIGTNNIDSNSRLCMSSAVTGYKKSLGVDAPPCCYDDVHLAKTIFISGSNAAFAHPILFRRIEETKKQHADIKLIVVDPRRTDTAKSADLHLQILPGTDVALHHGMLHLMLWEGWIDQGYIERYTEGFAALKELVRDYTPKAVAQLCGITESDLRLAAQWFAESPATMSLYCQGLNQSSSGTAKNTSLINLHLATGQIGKPGAGPMSLTGQPNAMGGREVGAMANLLSGHRDLSNPAHREEVAKLWQLDVVPSQPGMTAVPMFQALRDGKLKAIWIVCTNPAQSLPDQEMVHAALLQAEFVVVQEAYANTATARMADVLLPASSWGEKEGTVTNSERRISRVRAAIEPFRNARHDWQIAVDVARRLEARLRPTAPALFPYEKPEAIWLEHRESTRGRDLDITGLSYEILEQKGAQQWPMPEGQSAGQERLYQNGIFHTASGRAQFVAMPYTSTDEVADARYPFSLTTGRLRDQWHGMSRTGTVARLYSHAPEACIEISPRDAERHGLVAGELVEVSSRRGSQIFPVVLNDDVAPSQAFIPMHWGEEFISGHEGAQITHGVNSLTNPVTDRDSGQPELKYSAVRIVSANLSWHLCAFAMMSKNDALQLQNAMRPLLSQFAYASCVLFGRENDGGNKDTLGVLLRASHREAASSVQLATIEQHFDLLATGSLCSVMRYEDPRKQVLRMIHLGTEGKDSGKILGVLLTGPRANLAAESWLRVFMESGRDSQELGQALLSPDAVPPVPVKARGKIVCNCFNVSDSDIDDCLNASKAESGEPAMRLQQLQDHLKCGTNCGSCVPEIRQMIERHGDKHQ